MSNNNCKVLWAGLGVDIKTNPLDNRMHFRLVSRSDGPAIQYLDVGTATWRDSLAYVENTTVWGNAVKLSGFEQGKESIPAPVATAVSPALEARMALNESFKIVQDLEDQLAKANHQYKLAKTVFDNLSDEDRFKSYLLETYADLDASTCDWIYTAAKKIADLSDEVDLMVVADIIAKNRK